MDDAVMVALRNAKGMKLLHTLDELTPVNVNNGYGEYMPVYAFPLTWEDRRFLINALEALYGNKDKA